MESVELTESFIETLGKLFRMFGPKHTGEFSRGEMFILHYLIDSERAVQPREISSAMDISSARVAAALNSLESKGWITRSSNEQDRRKVMVDITDDGRRVAERQRQALFRSMQSLLELIDKKEICEFIRITDSIAEAVQNMEDGIKL